MQKYKPTIYVKDIYSINYEKLKEKNITTLLFDIDNTIANVYEKIPSKMVEVLFNALKEQGFKIFIITNALRKRALKFEKHLNVKTYYLSFKPHKKQYLKIIQQNNLNKKNIAAIGDQIFTDILGANKLHITSILVDPISSHESFITKINRIKEKKLIRKTNIIKKGNYYE